MKVEEGKDQVFTIQPYEGFEVKEVFVNGESVGAVTEYKFEAVRADASIEVFFAEKKQYRLTRQNSTSPLQQQKNF